MDFSSHDLLKATLVASGLIALTLAWVFKSRQSKVPRTFVSGLSITIRLLVINLCYFGCFGFGLGISADLLICLMLPPVIVAICSRDIPEPSSMDVLGVALEMMFRLPVYLIRQWVLGFPDRELLISLPPAAPVIKEVDFNLLDSCGTVISPLKPIGLIEIDGRKLSAVSLDGQFVEAGQTVRVCGKKQDIVTVCIASTSSSEVAVADHP